MANLELRLQTIRHAVTAFRDTPGRWGRLVGLQEADEVLVAGDIHGNLKNFQRMMVLADLGHHPRRHLVLQELIHGKYTYPDGSDRSHQLIDLVCALKSQYPRQVHYLIGNHELAQATGRSVMKNEEDLNNRFRAGVEFAYGNLAEEVYSLYMELLSIIPFALRTPGRVFFSHSLPSGTKLPEFDLGALENDPSRESDLEPGGALYSLVWSRDIQPETVKEFLALVDADLLITGHIPCDKGFERPSDRHLILDTQGCPAAAALVPAGRRVAVKELAGCIRLL